MAASTFSAVVNNKCRVCPVKTSCPVSGKGRQVTVLGVLEVAAAPLDQPLAAAGLRAEPLEWPLAKSHQTGKQETENET